MHFGKNRGNYDSSNFIYYTCISGSYFDTMAIQQIAKDFSLSDNSGTSCNNAFAA